MNTKIEGIVLSKTPYQDRHLVVSLLLRSGRKISVIFHGGQGGGTKRKSSILEIGHMMKVELSKSKHTSDLYMAKEWSILWAHDKIRYHHQAYYTLCFFVEMLLKVSTSDDLHDIHRDADDSSQGLFRVLSNAIFFLDREAGNTEYSTYDHLFFFLTKLSLESGVYPEREFCPFTESELINETAVVLLASEGAFVVYDSLDQTLEEYRQAKSFGKNLWNSLGLVAKTKYLELRPLATPDEAMVRSYFFYLCQQFAIEYQQFKTFSVLEAMRS
jgi:hypothetical protein